MSIRIITDSASDIDQQEFDNVTVLPMTITIEGTSYLDGVDLTKSEFYHMLASSDVMPVSSLVSPHQFSEVFAELEKTGDEAIVLTMSGELSGTAQSARIAAADYSDRVSVIDTRQVAGAEKILVEHCRRLIAEGKSRAEIVAQLEEEKSRIVIFAVVDTLKYLLKGGRISKSSALMGSVIGIKPIISLQDGKLVAVGKARGVKQSHIFLTSKIQEVGGIDYSLPFAVGYSGTDNANLLQYLENNRELLNASTEQPEIVQIGSTVGTHSGPNAVLVAFFANKPS